MSAQARRPREKPPVWRSNRGDGDGGEGHRGAGQQSFLMMTLSRSIPGHQRFRRRIDGNVLDLGKNELPDTPVVI
jgi:hypothetical protein